MEETVKEIVFGFDCQAFYFNRHFVACLPQSVFFLPILLLAENKDSTLGSTSRTSESE